VLKFSSLKNAVHESDGKGIRASHVTERSN